MDLEKGEITTGERMEVDYKGKESIGVSSMDKIAFAHAIEGFTDGTCDNSNRLERNLLLLNSNVTQRREDNNLIFAKICEELDMISNTKN